MADLSGWSIAELDDLLLRNVEGDFAGVGIHPRLEVYLLPDAMPVRDGYGVRTRCVDVTVLDDFAHRLNVTRCQQGSPRGRGRDRGSREFPLRSSPAEEPPHGACRLASAVTDRKRPWAEPPAATIRLLATKIVPVPIGDRHTERIPTLGLVGWAGRPTGFGPIRKGARPARQRWRRW